MRIEHQTGQMILTQKTGDPKVVREGDWVSIDGTTGEVVEGRIATKPSEVLQVLLDKSLDAAHSEVFRRYATLMEWADKARRLKVRANADQPDQATNAVAFGAEGIGLCRTEHMFFGGERITAVREMILADKTEDRERALDKILPMQREDFIGLFRAMGPRPVTIRTLDPPLHEFLPHGEKERESVARQTGVDPRLDRAQGRGPLRDEPDARPPRLPPRDHVPRDHADADARDPRGRVPREEGRDRREAGDHDSARRPRARARGPGEGRARRREEGLRERRASRWTSSSGR